MSLDLNKTANFSTMNSNSHEQFIWFYLSFTLIIFLTIFGNVMVVLAVLKNRNLQNTTNYFLMSLAIADCLVALIVWPISVVNEILGQFPFGFFVCNFWVTSDILLCTSSIWHMCVMSMDRFFTIKFPLKYGRNKTRKFMLLKIVCVWLISSLISSPMFVLGLVDSANVYHNDTKSSATCFPNHSDFKLYGSIFAFCIPLAIITVTYSFTMRSLKILMRNKEEVKRRLSLERFNACQANGYFSANGCNTQELRKILIAANRAASVGFKRNELSRKRNFVKRHRSFAVANNTPNSVFRLMNQDPPNLKALVDTNKKQTHNHIYQKQQHRNSSHLTGGGRSKIATLKLADCKHKNSLFATSLTSNTFIYEINMFKSSLSSYKLTQHKQQQQFSESKKNTNLVKTSLHLSMNKLNDGGLSSSHLQSYSQMSQLRRTRSESSSSFPRLKNMTMTNKLAQLGLEDDNRDKLRTQMFKSIFERNSTSVKTKSKKAFLSARSNSCFFESLNFETTKSILMRLNDIQNVMFGIENDTEKLLTASKEVRSKKKVSLANLKSNKQQSNQSNNTNRAVTLANENSRILQLQCSLDDSSSLIGAGYSQRRSTAKFVRQQRNNSISCDSGSTGNNEQQQQQQQTQKQQQKKHSQSHQLTHHRQSAAYYRSQYQRHVSTATGLFGSSFNSASLDYVFRNSTTLSTTASQRVTAKRKKYGVHRKSGASGVTVVIKSNRAINERKALKVLIIIFSIFVIFWSPFFIMNLISVYCNDDTCNGFITKELFLATTWLGYGSSTLNPIIYTMFNKSFRSAFINLLMCRTIPMRDMRKSERLLAYRNANCETSKSNKLQ